MNSTKSSKITVKSATKTQDEQITIIVNDLLAANDRDQQKINDRLHLISFIQQHCKHNYIYHANTHRDIEQCTICTKQITL